MIVALIPAFNEAPRIGSVVLGGLEHVPVLVIDDGSTDATADLARAAGATVIAQRPNQGKGAAPRGPPCPWGRPPPPVPGARSPTEPRRS